MIQVAGCKLPFISEIYNCIYSKKIVNKVSIIIIIIEQSSIVYTRSVHVVRFIAIFLLEPQFINKNIITIGFTGI